MSLEKQKAAYEAEIESCEEELAELERGDLQASYEDADGNLVDVTDKRIAELKHKIKTFRTFVLAIEATSAPKH
ncbi:hypothetical protein [Ensifer adhaerens]|uniref:hypothetical protein n=1 Tax=Ensifer adhaerens TaxID=106592 RepID=UPI000CF0AECC|nr:hypothetical protein [Ensifer adhaerens]